MTNFKNLVKLQLKNIFNWLIAKKTNQKSRTTFLIGALVVILLLFSFGSTYAGNAELLKTTNMLEFLFLQAGFIGLLFVIIMLTMESQSHFFMAKDYEMLASLPLKPRTIVASKFMAVLVSAYIYTALTLLPAVVVYFVYSSFSIVTLIYAIIWLMFFPLLPTFFASVLGLIFAFFNAKAKNKQLSSLIFCGVFVALYLIYSLNYQSVVNWLMASGTNLITAFCLVVPSAGLFLWSFFGGGILAMLIYVAVNILFAYFAILIVSSLYSKINMLMKQHSAKASKKDLSFKPSTVFRKLIKKEAKTYFGDTTYVMNTLIMAIMGVILPVVYYFSNSLVSSMPVLDVSLLLFAILAVTMPTANTACVSLSMEGEKFASLKSLPVSPQKIMLAKIAFNIILVLPFVLLGGALSLILFKNSFSILTGVLLFIVPIVAVIGMSIFGMIMNLVYPKLKFTSSVQVVKQSASAGFGIMGGILINILPIIIFIAFLNSVMSFEMFVLCDLLYTLTFTLIFALIFFKKGKKLYNKIAC